MTDTARLGGPILDSRRVYTVGMFTGLAKAAVKGGFLGRPTDVRALLITGTEDHLGFDSKTVQGAQVLCYSVWMTVEEDSRGYGESFDGYEGVFIASGPRAWGIL
jgi:hypothetical protein